MAERDLLDYMDESELNVNRTPESRLKMGRLSRSRQKSVRKSRNLRMLSTHQESLDLEDNDGILPEPYSKRIRSSSTSCTTTVGDGSHIDSSFDVVAVTPGVSRTQVLPSQSCLNKSTLVSGMNLKVVPKPMQQHKRVHDLFNNNNMERLSPISEGSETDADGQNAVNVVDNSMFERSDRMSPSGSGTTKWQVTNRKAETTVHKKSAQLVQTSGLTWTSHRAEQAASTHKPQHLNEEKNDLPATQPVSSLLLKGQYKQLL